MVLKLPNVTRIAEIKVWDQTKMYPFDPITGHFTMDWRGRCL
jgi:hypothetical protein